MEAKSTIGFAKTERICLKKEIDRLFEVGTTLKEYPLRVIYLPEKPQSGATVAVLISVPKKRFKRAVKRNRIKRLIRETYRLHKHSLIDALSSRDSGMLLAFLYMSDRICSFAEMKIAMQNLLNKLANQL
ncbi:MAG: ribonuclease P protein component [Candidatus Symbiothrix sp.]|nr:ribonuclease P protein component [Candidatus Symbiothrix sp.]